MIENFLNLFGLKFVKKFILLSYLNIFKKRLNWKLSKRTLYFLSHCFSWFELDV